VLLQSVRNQGPELEPMASEHRGRFGGFINKPIAELAPLASIACLHVYEHFERTSVSVDLPYSVVTPEVTQCT
jgi:hypothetical protein